MEFWEREEALGLGVEVPEKRIGRREESPRRVSLMVPLPPPSQRLTHN